MSGAERFSLQPLGAAITFLSSQLFDVSAKVIIARAGFDLNNDIAGSYAFVRLPFRMFVPSQSRSGWGA